ncbi:MAG: methyltransferase domain-containing protein [Thermodesulfobacteriota bacterium]
MKKWLTERLICPECTGEEIPLDLTVHEERDDDILDGELTCPACRRAYPIRGGVAIVLPAASRDVLHETSGYNSRIMLSAYLWSHFSDLLKDPEATDAYRIWSSFFRESAGDALDIGCSVGRLSFELSKTHSRVIGIDTSVSFIKTARDLMKRKALEFDLVIEGLLTEKRSGQLDPAFRLDRVEFIVADALALPFRKQAFAAVTSINILEKVAVPLKHLANVNRVLQKNGAMFVFSDPFSWDESVSPPDLWLSAGTNGNGRLRGIDSIGAYLKGKGGVFDPPLTVIGSGQVPWKIRKTENLWEHIRSQFVVGIRSQGG